MPLGHIEAISDVCLRNPSHTIVEMYNTFRKLNPFVNSKYYSKIILKWSISAKYYIINIFLNYFQIPNHLHVFSDSGFKIVTFKLWSSVKSISATQFHVISVKLNLLVNQNMQKYTSIYIKPHRYPSVYLRVTNNLWSQWNFWRSQKWDCVDARVWRRHQNVPHNTVTSIFLKLNNFITTETLAWNKTRTKM